MIDPSFFRLGSLDDRRNVSRFRILICCYTPIHNLAKVQQLDLAPQPDKILGFWIIFSH